MPELAITIDDLPVHLRRPSGVSRLEILVQIASALDVHGVRNVCGFCNPGVPVDDHSISSDELFKFWTGAGHLLGNHGAMHVSLHQKGVQAFLQDIYSAEVALAKYRDEGDVRYFRYPFLCEGRNLEEQRAVRNWLAENRLMAVPVTVNFGDWAWHSVQPKPQIDQNEQFITAAERLYETSALSALQRAEELSHKLFGRSIPHILLLHAGYFTARMLTRLLGAYRNRGVTFVPLQQALGDPAYSYPKGGFVCSGYTWLDQLTVFQQGEISGLGELPEMKYMQFRASYKRTLELNMHG